MLFKAIYLFSLDIDLRNRENKQQWKFLSLQYGKCPKILYTKVSDKMAYVNSADPDQTAPMGAVWSGSTLFAISLNILTLVQLN